MKYYHAIVIENDDSKHKDGQKKSRIQVRILPQLKDVEEKLLPWVFPFSGSGMSENNFSHNPPEKNSHIWVFFQDEPYWKEGYYITGRIIKGLFDISKWDTASSKVLDKNSSTYPNPRFIALSDGSFMFWDTDTGDKGILQPNGTYLLFKGDGKVFLNTNDQDLKIYTISGSINVESTTGDVTLKSGTGNITLKAIGAMLWVPNALPNCLFAAVPHGGSAIGITNLKGGLPT